MQRNSSALTGVIAVICAYVLTRSCIYHYLPVVSIETWFRRDTLMSIPRLGALVTLLFLNRNWQVTRLEMPGQGLGRAALLGSVPIALWAFYFHGGRGLTFPLWMMSVGFFTSLIVGLFEEFAFRGVLQSALGNRFSLLTTVVTTNLLFTIYHIQAEPLASWPAVFLTGVIFSNLRLRGLGLGWLALIHGLVDASWFFCPVDPPDIFGANGWILQAGLVVYAVLTFPGANEFANSVAET